jgi:LysM repeat protein
MKSTIVISAVVLMHAAVFSLIGCNSQSGFEDIKANTNRSTAKETAAPETPAEATRTNGPDIAPDHEGFADTQPIIEPASQPKPGNTSAVVQAPVEQPAGKTYIVKRGDSISRIAKQEGVSRHALASANGLPDDAGLKEKQKLIIPAKGTGLKSGTTSAANVGTANNNATGAAVAAPAADGTRIHVVKSGETLAPIARKYGTTVAKIKELNGITDDRKVRAGSKLTIPAATKKAAAAPAPSSSAPAPAPDAAAGGLPTLDPVPPLEPLPGAEAGTVTVSPEPLPAQPEEAPAAGASEAVRTPAPAGAAGF